jgi:hypothetical protein
MRSLKRRQRFIPAPTGYRCQGGPWNGATIFLQDGFTAWFEAGGSSGRYSPAAGCPSASAPRWKTFNRPTARAVQWEPNI